MNNVTPSRELDRVPARPAARIKDLRAWQYTAIDQPRSDRRAFFMNGPIDKEVERPRVLGVEGTIRDFAHTDGEFVGPTAARHARRLGSLVSFAIMFRVVGLTAAVQPQAARPRRVIQFDRCHSRCHERDLVENGSIGVDDRGRTIGDPVPSCARYVR